MRGPLTWLGGQLADYLSQERPRGEQVGLVNPGVLSATLRPCDVLLVEGNTRLSVAIKYLTQSTWSHAALYVGSALGPGPAGRDANVLIEADVREGVRAVPLSEYASMHTRICRPAGLKGDDVAKVIAYAAARIGHQYDLKNVIDLARYLLPTPPVPARFRRRIISARFSRRLLHERATFQNAFNELCSRKMHALITTRSRVVMASQFRRYKSHVMFLIRIRNRFFTECMLISAGSARRFPGNTFRT